MRNSKLTLLTFLGTKEARLLISSYLKNGFSVIHELPGGTPLESMRNHEPDIVLVEMGHPGLGGLELVCAIHKDPLYAELPLVGIGLRESDGKDKIAMLAGCCGFIHYPLQADSFRAQILSYAEGVRDTLDLEDSERYHNLFSSALIEKLEARLRVLEEKTAALEEEKTNRDQLMFQVLSSLVTMIEAKDPYLTGHSRHVTKYAVSLAKTLGIDGEDIRLLERASLLHDIGKISIDLQQINKAGPLNDEEWKEIKQHPETGFRILSVIDFLQEEAELIKYHHCKWTELSNRSDLSPRIRRLVGVLTLVDAFDAMTTQRPYNKPFDLKGAVKEMRRCAGDQFSPEMVEAFVGMLQESYAFNPGDEDQSTRKH